MQLDTRIPLMAQGAQIEPYQNQLARALQVRQLQGRVDEQDRSMQQRNALAGVLGDAFDDSGRLTPGSLGRIAQAAPDFAPQYAQVANTQQRLDRQDAVTNAQLGQKRFQWLQNAVGAAKDYDSALAQIDLGVRGGFIQPQEAQAWVQEIPRDPVQFATFIDGINKQMMTASQRAELSQGNYGAPVFSDQGIVQFNKKGDYKVAQGPGGQPLRPASFDPNTQGDVSKAKARGTAQGKAEVESEQGFGQAEATANQIMGVIDKAMNHPGREYSTGMSSMLPVIAGTPASDFRAVLDQIKGQAFLQAFESLKGGGQITEVEGQKATQAIARLDTAQSEEEFLRSLQDLRDVVGAGLERARRKAGASAAPPAAGAGGVLSSAPATPAAARTKVRTGTLDGRKVVEYSDGSVEYAD